MTFIKLLNQLKPGAAIVPEGVEGDSLAVATIAVEGATRSLGVSTFHTPQDICRGDSTLNQSFVAAIFNAYIGLDEVESQASAYELLLRWVNFHLTRSGVGAGVTNLGSDLQVTLKDIIL